MHEYMVARGVVESLLRYLSESGRVVKSFRVVVGELSMLDVEILTKTMKNLLEQSPLKGADFTVEVERAQIVCGLCGKLMSFNEATSKLDDEEKEVIHFIPDLIGSYSSCSKCGSMDLRVVAGRWVEVKDVIS
ncbi:MAG: hydrogenase/urease maturation nickel metallochaperone HypA [Candidatus Caldarchaeum sp.]|nr:hydrogenase/urease maturation nickel metallochaperone HypA [Candidatus Caldarchaeum sp.]